MTTSPHGTAQSLQSFSSDCKLWQSKHQNLLSGRRRRQPALSAPHRFPVFTAHRPHPFLNKQAPSSATLKNLVKKLEPPACEERGENPRQTAVSQLPWEPGGYPNQDRAGSDLPIFFPNSGCGWQEALRSSSSLRASSLTSSCQSFRLEEPRALIH